MTQPPVRCDGASEAQAALDDVEVDRSPAATMQEAPR